MGIKENLKGTILMKCHAIQKSHFLRLHDLSKCSYFNSKWKKGKNKTILKPKQTKKATCIVYQLCVRELALPLLENSGGNEFSSKDHILNQRRLGQNIHLQKLLKGQNIPIPPTATRGEGSHPPISSITKIYHLLENAG